MWLKACLPRHLGNWSPWKTLLQGKSYRSTVIAKPSLWLHGPAGMVVSKLLVCHKPGLVEKLKTCPSSTAKVFSWTVVCAGCRNILLACPQDPWMQMFKGERNVNQLASSECSWHQGQVGTNGAVNEPWRGFNVVRLMELMFVLFCYCFVVWFRQNHFFVLL